MEGNAVSKLALENMLEVLEYERKRISLSLHDSVQNKLRLLRDEIKDPRQRHQIEDILDELRTIAYNLVPKSLQEFSLAEYLQIYAATLTKTYRHTMHTDYRTNVQISVPKQIETELFNIVQECMTNIIKYAHSPNVLLRYNQLADKLEVIVQDIGDGFDLEDALQKNSIGLRSILARTELVGGTCDIKTAPDGGGARVKITVPLPENRLAEERTIFDEDIENRLKTTSAPNPEQLHEKAFEPKVFLLVDNQPEITIGLIPILTKEWPQATFLAATSAEEAFIFLEKMPVDILITDISMPDKSGLTLLEYVKGQYPQIKTFIYSINDNPAYVYRATRKEEKKGKGIVLDVSGYVWKEDIPTTKKQHQLVTAVKHVICTGTPFYSRQIQETITFLDSKKHNPTEDEKHRSIFRQYAIMLRDTSKHDLLLGKEKWRKWLSEQVREELDMVADHSSIDRYFRQFKQDFDINEDWELIQFIIQIANDFGFFDENSK